MNIRRYFPVLYPTAYCIACLFNLLLLVTGCTNELPAGNLAPETDWLPVEIASVRISDMEMKEIGMGGTGTKAITTPPEGIIKAEVADIEEIFLFYTLNGTQEMATASQNADGTWGILDSKNKKLILPRDFSGTITARLWRDDQVCYSSHEMKDVCTPTYENGKLVFSIGFNQVTTGIMVHLPAAPAQTDKLLYVSIFGTGSDGNEVQLGLTEVVPSYYSGFIGVFVNPAMTVKIYDSAQAGATPIKEFPFTSNELSASTDPNNNKGDFYTINIYTTFE